MRKEALRLQDIMIEDKYTGNLDDDRMIYKYQDKVIKLNDPGLAEFFAWFVPTSDRKTLGQMVIDSDDPFLNIFYPLFVDPSRYLENGEVIMRSDDPVLNYCFPILFEGADVLGHGKAIKY